MKIIEEENNLIKVCLHQLKGYTAYQYFQFPVYRFSSQKLLSKSSLLRWMSSVQTTATLSLS